MTDLTAATSNTELDRRAANIAEARRRALAAQDDADRAKATYTDQLDQAAEALTTDEFRALTVRLLDLRPDSSDLCDRASIRFERTPF